MSDLITIQKQIKEDEYDFIASVEWLRKELKLGDFSKETLYLLRQLAFHYDLDGRNGPMAGIDQEMIIRLVKERIAQEKKEESDRQRNMERTLLEAVEDENEKEYSDENQPGNGPHRTEEIPIEPELFSSQEREGIKAISAYHGILYGSLPDIAAFRERFLPKDLLSEIEADEFLKSPAIRFLSLSDFEKLGVFVLDHESRILDLFTEKLSLEQRNKLEGDFVVYPVPDQHLSDQHLSDQHYPSQKPVLKQAKRWYQYTVTIEITSPKKKPNAQKHILEKTLLVAEQRPFSMLYDPFFEAGSFQIQGIRFIHLFPTSVADHLHKILRSRTSLALLPGKSLEKAMFVLTGTLSYQPVTVQTIKQAVPNLNEVGAGALIAKQMQYAHLNEVGAGALIAKQMQYAHRSCDRILVEADAWIKAETIGRIFYQSQSLISRTASDNTRYKISNSESFQLVTDIINIYIKEKVMPSYQRAFDLLRQTRKITGTADNFRKKYKRACEILNIPLNIDDAVRHMRNRL